LRYFFQAEDGIRDDLVTGVQTCALPICRFSALDQINVSNAATLVPKWAYQTIAGGKFEATPLVVDGILYGTGQDDRVYALDARSGRPIWQYQQTLPADIRPCCGRVNRGVALLGDRVFVATLDAHAVVLDGK